MHKILHIDDDTELGDLLKQYLLGEGFDAHYCSDPLEGLNVLNQQHFDLLILDVMMPGKNGLDTLNALRQRHQTPVLMLTAKGDDIDRIVGLELGADDYVAKPCLPREIVARIRAILRRAAASPSGTVAVLKLGELELQAEKRQVKIKGQHVELTSAEFNILEVLLKHPGEMVSKSSLCELGLGRPLARYDRAIDVHLSSLRSKLGLNAEGPSPCGLRLHTIRGQGVQLSEL